MYTDNELLISNKSYTSKDFLSIFPELLDTVKKLTNKWDPSTSNESDPGVVLLKLGALLADKNNYNIDKNILETFPLSVTQRANAWKLYDMLGYSMGWYKAATTDLTLTYTGDLFKNGYAGSITIPKYTMFTDDSGLTVYTLIDSLRFNESSIPLSGQALQGVIHDYEVNGVTDITLDNLDSELRLFFTDKTVAQNGIFIQNKGAISGNWRLVDNLEVETLNSQIYKFGIMPNTDTCYIQFPQDIGNLIGGGLNIKYITTNGVAGNVKANIINSFMNDFTPADEGYSGGSINEDFIIKNAASTSSGCDPEDIDEAYRNYKKTIGTFDTIVTLRDYENAIYKADDGYGRPYVSNVVASDRTCDINYTTNVIELTPDGNKNTGLVYKDPDNNSSMDVFDVAIYALNPMTPVYDSDYYFNKSFSPVLDPSDIYAKIDNYKLSTHDHLLLMRDNPYIYKNFYTLNGKVITYYKVTNELAKEIEDNIKKALFRRYNARNVEFGLPVNYDDIVSTIQLSDTRIKTVLLSEPQYELRYTTLNDSTGQYKDSLPIRPNDKDTTITTKDHLIIKLLARMILSGNVLLYKFDRDIEYMFGLKNIQKYSNITKMTPNSTLDDEDAKDLSGYSGVGMPPAGSVGYTDSSSDEVEGYEVKKNQNVQLFAPNLYTEKAYTSYVNYSLYDSAASSTATATGSGSNWQVTIGSIDYDITVTNDENGYPSTVKLGDSNLVLFDSKQDLDNYISGTVSLNGIIVHMMVKMDDSDIEEIKFSWGDGSFVVPLGVYYRLKPSQKIYINYTDSNDSVHNEVILGGTIIKFTDSNDESAVLSTTKSVITKGDIGYSTLTASQQIDVLAVNKQTKRDKKLYCMWFTNDYTKLLGDGLDSDTIVYTLFKAGLSLRMLQDSEYFIYTNEDKNELVMLGSGTIIQRLNASGALQSRIRVSVSDVISEGVSAITDDSEWFEYNALSNNLTFIETQVVTLGEGSVVKADVLLSDYSKLTTSGELVRVKNALYKEKNTDSDDFIPLVNFDLDGDGMYLGIYCGWTLTMKLNVMTGPDTMLEIRQGDSLSLYSVDPSGNEILYSQYTNASLLIVDNSLSGGANVCMSSNSTLAFSGSDQLSVTRSDNLYVNIYRYIYDDIYTDIGAVYSNGVATISHSLWKTAHNGSKKVYLPFSFGYDVADNAKMLLTGYKESYTCRTYRIPVVLVGDKSTVVIKVKIYNGDDVDYDDGEYTLNKTDSVQFIEYTDTSYNDRFAGIEVTGWTTDGGGSVQDFIRVEGLYVNEQIGSSTSSKYLYGDQLTTTIEKYYGDNWTSTASSLGDAHKAMQHVVKYVKNDTGYRISGNNTFRFNDTYIVDLTEMVDTDVASKSDLNNLFSDNSVWDINHVCNKFTIPQLNTDTLNIRVAASSLK